MLDAPAFSAFEPHVGSQFRFGSDRHLRLENATEMTPADLAGEQFSLVFSGPSDDALGQGMVRLEHAEIGTFDLFLVPVGMGPDGRRSYEAFFNRLRVPDR